MKLNIELNVEDNYHNTSLKIAADTGKSQGSVLTDLTEDDPACRLHLCDILQDLCIRNPRLIKQIIIFSPDPAVKIILTQ